MFDSKKLGDEILKMGCQSNDQLRSLFGSKASGIGTCCKQPARKDRVVRFEVVDEISIDSKQAIAMVEVFELKTETQIERVRGNWLSADRHWV